MKNAQNAGAIAVVVGNTANAIQPMSGTDPSITIPSLLVALDHRNLIAGRLTAGDTVSVTLRPKSDVAPENSYRWLGAEDATAFNPSAPPGGHALRDMWNPNCLSDPGKVTDAEYHCATTDGGGVHTNSGVPNHGFALLVDGGTYNGHTVAAVGLTKAAHIYWRAQTVYQTPASDFADHADALQASCRDLIGAPLRGLSTGAPTGPSRSDDRGSRLRCDHHDGGCGRTAYQPGDAVQLPAAVAAGQAARSAGPARSARSCTPPVSSAASTAGRCPIKVATPDGQGSTGVARRTAGRPARSARPSPWTRWAAAATWAPETSPA